ncbi:hypothetical protein EHM82_01280 [bacterium]|nr:MAG: hypothetical protein EHM82_01280 [bacterium]
MALSAQSQQFLVSCEFAGQERVCRGRLFDPQGKPAGAEIPLFEGLLSCAEDPSLTSLHGGTIAVAWSCSRRSDPSSLWIWVQVASPEAGKVLGPPFPASRPASLKQSSPLIAPRPGGGFWVLWIEESASSAGTLWGRRFEADGSSRSPAEPLSTPGALQGRFRRAAAAAGPSGDLFVVWSGFGPDAGRQPEIYLQRIDDAGTRMEPVRVSEEQKKPSSANVEPALAVSSRGEIAVVWLRKAGPQLGWGRLLSPEGRPLGPELRLGTRSDTLERSIAVAAAGSRFVAVWLDLLRDGSEPPKTVARIISPPTGGEGKPFVVSEGPRSAGATRNPVALTAGTSEVAVYELHPSAKSSAEAELIGCRVPAQRPYSPDR